jgi:hypothetical protein
MTKLITIAGVLATKTSKNLGRMRGIQGRIKIIKNIWGKMVDSDFFSAKVAPLCVTDQSSFGVCAE